MNSIVAYAERHKLAIMAFAVMAFVILAVTPDIASAQGAFNENTALNAIRTQVRPFISLARRLAVIALGILCVKEIFQAARGGDGKYSNALIMAVVGFFLVSPSTILSAVFGSTFSELSSWGL